ncbi:hypothetical protein M5K25_010333 [Dendrobium thyrsiflorum]|uniref:Protein kinase domain-containing protein n=1 Tax=Dendrobium thyrsiflorum TaxID=117978 RepID=A0ABD0V050_DENTH
MDGVVANPSVSNSALYYVPSASGRTPSENNLCDMTVQTGEDRVTGGNPIRTGFDYGYMKRMGFNVKHNPCPDYEDHTSNFGLRRIESDLRCDASSCFFPRVHALEVNSRGYIDTANTNLAGNNQRIIDNQFNDSGKCSSSDHVHGFQTCTYMRGTLESPHSGKVKFLCSFGGKILPRPGDGKLRYVGGETRIISIKKDLSWKELMNKTINIFSAPHVIKYQLPGEDLDALISVSSEEDLQNMMDEYHAIDKADGSQRLRIFLIPLNESESCSLDTTGLQCSSEYQYFVAVNNIADRSPRESSSGNSLSSQVGYQLDKLQSFPKGSHFLQVDSMEGMQRDTGIYEHHNNSKPSVCFQIAPSSPTHSPPFSPKLGQQREMRHSRKQSFKDHFIADQSSENHYDLNRANLMNVDVQSFHSNIHCDVEMQVRQSGPQFPNKKDTVSDSESAGHSLREKSFLQEKLFHFEKFIKEQEDSLSWVAGSNDSASSIQVMPHAFLDPSLHDISERNISGLTESNGSHLELKKSVVSRNSFQRNTQEETPCFKHMLINNRSDILSELQRTALTPSHMKAEFSINGNSAESCGRNEAMNESNFQLAENTSAEPIKRISSGELEYRVKDDLDGSASDWPDEKGNHLPQPMKYCQKNNDVTSHTNSKLQDYDYNFSIVHGAVLSSPVVEVVESCLPTYSPFSPCIDLEKAKELSLGNQFDGTVSEDHRNFCYQSHGSLEARKSNLIDADNIRMTFAPTASTTGDSSQVLMPKITAERKDENIILVDRHGDMSLSSEPALHLPTTIRTHISKDYGGQGIDSNGDSGPTLRINEGSKTLVFQKSENDQVSRQQFSLLDQDMVNYCDPRPRNIELGNSGNETVRPEQVDPTSNMHNNGPVEALITVEDVTDRVPFGVPVAATIIPHVIEYKTEEEEELENPSRRVASANSTPRSECEDVEDDEIDTDGSMSDAAIAEIEAGIYGLQIIKNADLEELRELGSGTFGTVFHGKWRGTDVAIKRIKKSCFSGKLSEQDRLTKDFWREAQILSKLHHPNVVAFYGVVPDGGGGSLATVTEFMVNGSLRHVLLRKDRTLDHRRKLMIAMDAAFGMEYLHSKNIVHFDLKCDNLLVNLRDSQRPICKVGDFGLSRIKRNTLVSGGVRGTLPWMAPELLTGSSTRVSEKVDVFSFGIAMWEIITGEEPYANMHCGAIIGGIISNTLRPPIPEHCDADWRKLMEQCWSADPSQRPSFTEITNSLRSMSMALQSKKVQAQANR